MTISDPVRRAIINRIAVACRATCTDETAGNACAGLAVALGYVAAEGGVSREDIMLFLEEGIEIGKAIRHHNQSRGQA